ncbi:MAG: hypothetical protein HY815_33505 [Candidatus Riflebacteria bacterium]|nr:hypothetical protein [Candidatus Riflebacteria bacterium]
MPTSGKEVVFRKEPPFAGQDVVRRALETGPDRTGYVGFAWDVLGQKLYLDLNRNLDLTDDPKGVLRNKSGSPVFQKFPSVPIESTKDEVPVTHRVDLELGRFTTELYCTMTIRSGWRGEIELAGERWQLGIVDDLDRRSSRSDRLILTPPEAAKQTSPEAARMHRKRRLELPLLDSLHLNGYGYDVRLAFRSGPEGSSVAATFTETRPALGRLEVTGQSIGRIVLQRTEPIRSGAVIIDSPKRFSPVPLGFYDYSSVDLEGGETTGWFVARTGPITILADAPRVFGHGAPLQNLVTVEREGSTLALSYKLQGVGGETYQLEAGPGEDSRPGLTIRHEGRQLVSDHFEYG